MHLHINIGNHTQVKRIGGLFQSPSVVCILDIHNIVVICLITVLTQLVTELLQ